MIDERRPDEGLPEGFLELPGEVYRGDERWIPEDAAAVERAFSPDNPWFSQGAAVLLSVPGEARLALFSQPDLRVNGRRVVFFGYWESTGLQGADVPLFARAAAIASERWGAEDLYGPINFTTFGDYRLRLTCEPGGLTFPDEPYNPAAYPRLLEESGFTTDQLYLTQVGNIEAGRMVREWKRPKLEELLSQGYKLETLTHSMWIDSLVELHPQIDHIFGANFAYSAISFAAFSEKCGEGYIRRACPETSVMLRGPSGDLAGFFLVYPHYGPLVAQAAGERRVAAADLSYDAHYEALSAGAWTGCVAKTVGVMPAHRGKGVMSALTVGIFDRGDGRYEHWYGAMIRKGNLSRNFAEGNTVGERWYGLYRKRL
jgi:GNAT superfamily N-acetyltransferase